MTIGNKETGFQFIRTYFKNCFCICMCAMLFPSKIGCRNKPIHSVLRKCVFHSISRLGYVVSSSQCLCASRDSSRKAPLYLLILLGCLPALQAQRPIGKILYKVLYFLGCTVGGRGEISQMHLLSPLRAWAEARKTISLWRKDQMYQTQQKYN